MKIEGKLTWTNEAEQQKNLQERIKIIAEKWKTGEQVSRDGYIQAAEGKFKYKGISFFIRVLRYFNDREGFKSMRLRITDKHVVVEFPEETKPIVNILEEFKSEFLYHDTLHSWNDNQTVEEQIEACKKMAKDDIDGIPKILPREIKHLKEKIKKLKELQIKLLVR